MKHPQDKLTKGEIKSKKAWLRRKGMTGEDVEQVIGHDDQDGLTAEDIERKLKVWGAVTEKPVIPEGYALRKKIFGKF